jgi:hypothetical protein
MAGGNRRGRDLRPDSPPSLDSDDDLGVPSATEVDCERCGRRHYSFQRCAPDHPDEADEQEERLLRELADDPAAPWPQDAG